MNLINYLWIKTTTLPLLLNLRGHLNNEPNQIKFIMKKSKWRSKFNKSPLLTNLNDLRAHPQMKFRTPLLEKNALKP